MDDRETTLLYQRIIAMENKLIALENAVSEITRVAIPNCIEKIRELDAVMPSDRTADIFNLTQDIKNMETQIKALEDSTFIESPAKKSSFREKLKWFFP